MIVAFSGIDGSGKTTIANLVRELLQEAGLPALYRHEYSYPIVSHFFRLLGKGRIDRERSKFLSRRGNQGFWAKLWPFCVYLDAIAVQVYYQILRRRHVLILDRFIYDQLISFEELGVTNKVVRWIYAKFPRPTVSILVCVDPEVAFTRKRDTHSFNVGDYRRGQEAYLGLARPLRMKTVYNNAALRETLHRVVDVVLENGTLRRAFFRKTVNNRVLYKLICSHSVSSHHFQEAKAHYEMMRQRLVRSLRFLHDRLTNAGIDWMLLKSYMDFEYIPTYDLDIAVKPSNLRRATEQLTTDDASIDRSELGKVNIKIRNLFTFSLHQSASWDGFSYVTSRLLWDDPRTVEWHGFSTMVPRVEADLLTHFAHMLFEVTSIRLCDLLYVRSLLSHPINWGLVASEVRTRGWDVGFYSLFSLILSLLERLKAGRPVGFPYPVPYHLLLMSLCRKASFETGGKLPEAKWTPLFRDTTRFLMWQFYQKMFDKAPFGDTLRLPGSKPNPLPKSR